MVVRQAASYFGFLTVRLNGEHGYVGALLVINSLARPIEFHCSLPIKPTKSQSILYGPTLDEFICGEQIANALISKTKSKPSIVFTDTLACLAVRNVLDDDVLVIGLESEANKSSSEILQTRPTLSNAKLNRFSMQGYRVATHIGYPDDSSRAAHVWQHAEADIDLSEPFGRIEQALIEAQPASKAA